MSFRFFFHSPATPSPAPGTPTLLAAAMPAGSEDGGPTQGTAPEAACGAAEADRIARLQAFREALTRQIEEDRLRWAAEGEGLRSRREEAERLARDLDAERRLRQELERKAEALEAQLLRLRQGQRTARDSAGVAPERPGPDSWRDELARRLGDLSARAEKQISDVKNLGDQKRLDDIERVEDLKRRQALRRQAILRGYETPQRDAV